MLTENSQVYGLNGRSYRLGPELGSGGEGTVFDIPGEHLVIKIYKTGTTELEKKLRYMVMHPVPSLTDQYGNPILNLAWPRDIVFDQQGFVGYAMPKLEDALEIFHVVRGYKSPKVKQLWPNYTWELNVQVARNLALAVFHLHSNGYVIGDMNDKNIMVRPDGAVCILDIDSFDFTDASTGIHYRCGVGLADYLAPELHGRNLRTANFSAQTDDYALAIHIFQLLMDNHHPFTGRQLVKTQNSSSANQRVQRMVDGICPFLKNIPGYDIPADAPKLEEMLPQKLRADFSQTFSYDSTTALSAASRRTTAEQWARDLNDFLMTCKAGDLVRCSANPEHYYLRSIGICGHCAAQRRFQAIPTPKPPVPKPVQTTRPTQPVRTSSIPSGTTSSSNRSSSSGMGFYWPVVFLLVILAIIIFKPFSTSDSPKTKTGAVSPFVQSTAHTHDWVPATYDTPEYCSSCGEQQGNVKGYIGDIGGTWEDMKINGWNSNMLHLSTPIAGMRKMTVHLKTEMNAGTRCKNWDLYIRTDQWEKKGTIYLADGYGEGSITLYGDGTEWVEWIAVVPTVKGNYSYTQWLYVSDAQQN